MDMLPSIIEAAAKSTLHIAALLLGAGIMMMMHASHSAPAKKRTRVSAAFAAVLMTLGIAAFLHHTFRTPDSNASLAAEASAPESSAPSAEEGSSSTRSIVAANASESLASLAQKMHAARDSGDFTSARTYVQNAITVARDTGNRRGEMDALLFLGEIELLFGRIEQASDAYGRMLQIAREVGDELGAARALVGEAFIHKEQGNLRQAELKAAQARQVVERTGQDRDKAGVYMLMASIELSRARPAAAGEFIEKAKSTIFDPNYIGHAQSLLLMADYFGILGKVEYQRELLKKSREIYEKRASTRGLAVTSLKLAESYRLDPDHASEVHNLLRDAEIKFKQMGDVVGEASTLHLAGLWNDQNSRYDDASAHYRESLRLFRSARDKAGEAMLLHSMGRHYLLIGQADEATKLFTESEATYRVVGDERGQAQSKIAQAELAMQRGNRPLALRLFGEAEALMTSIGHTLGLANVLVTRGELEYRSANFIKARQDFEKSISLYTELGLISAIGMARIGLGDIDMMEDKIYSAQRQYDAAATECKVPRMDLCIGQALLGRAATWRKLDRDAEARKDIDEALDLFKTMGHVKGTADSLFQLALVESKEKRYDKARPLLERARSHYISTNDLIGAANVLQTLGGIEKSSAPPRLPEAERALIEALALFQRVGNRYGEAITHAELGKLYTDKLGPASADARRHFEEAAVVYDTIGQHDRAQHIRDSFLASKARKK